MCLTHTLLCAYRRCNNFNQFSLNYFFKNHTPKCVNRSKIYKWLLMLLKLKDLLQLPTIQPSSWYIYRVSHFNWVPFLKPQSSIVGHENILFLYVIILNFQLKGSTYLPSPQASYHLKTDRIFEKIQSRINNNSKISYVQNCSVIATIIFFRFSSFLLWRALEEHQQQHQSIGTNQPSYSL